MSWRYSYHLKGNPTAGGAGRDGWNHRNAFSMPAGETLEETRKLARIWMESGQYCRITLSAAPQSQLAAQQGRAKDHHTIETYERHADGRWTCTRGAKTHAVHLDRLHRSAGVQTSIFDII